ncbi:alpha/beta hydrolase [Frigidibacter sp. MR17.24]|uniref:alpha/beta hydrolase n=1 Tax=Frigidibacter sp. MR17.24 TaxID=3127345 RepID=UPI003012A7A6
MTLYRQFRTQEELDDEYRPEARITDPSIFEKVIASRIEWAAAARRELKMQAGLKYGPTRLESLDFFSAGAGSPILVFIHGGYWFDGRLRKENYSWVARGLNAHGVSVAVIDYDVCPKVTIDEITRSCRAAVAWLHANAAALGADGDRLYVTGNSAGGHLTAMVSLTDWAGDYDLPADTVKGGCPISGLYDLQPFQWTWLQPKIQLTGQQIARNSPMVLARADLPPQLVAWGAEESDEFHRQSTDFCAAWQAAGNRAELMPIPGANHHAANTGFGDPDSLLCQRVVAHMFGCFS